MTSPKMTPAQKRIYEQAKSGASVKFNRRASIDAWFVVAADGSQTKVDRWVAGRAISFPGMVQVANSPVESVWQYRA